MTLKMNELEGFTIVGIEVRTNNKKEAAGEGEIPKHWMRYFKNQIAAQIPNKVDETLYATYMDYESDFTGDYSFVLGLKVSKVDQLPKGLVAKNIPKSKYAVFTTETGAMDQVVIQKWQEIWQMKKTDLHRTYQADFEVYDDRVTDFQHAQIEIYVGVK